MGASVLSKAMWESSHLRPAELRQKTGFHYLVLQVAVCRISTAPLCKRCMAYFLAILASFPVTGNYECRQTQKSTPGLLLSEVVQPFVSPQLSERVARLTVANRCGADMRG